MKGQLYIVCHPDMDLWVPLQHALFNKMHLIQTAIRWVVGQIWQLLVNSNVSTWVVTHQEINFMGDKEH